MKLGQQRSVQGARAGTTEKKKTKSMHCNVRCWEEG